MLMVINMLVTGRRVKKVVVENCTIRMVISLGK